MRRSILACFLLGFALIIFFWPTVGQGHIYSLGGVLNSDFLLFHLPLHEVYRQALLVHRLPWWISGVGSGYPLVAEGQLGAFYPPNILLFRFFPTNTALSLSILLHSFLAGLGTYLLVYTFTRSKGASLFSALSFSLSGFLIAHIITVNLFITASIFPWAVLYYLKLTTKPGIWAIVKLVFIFTMQILAGYVPLFFYSLVTLIIFGLLKAGKNFRKQILFIFLLAFSIGLALALSAIQIVPTWELFHETTRQKVLSLPEATLFSFAKEGTLSLLGKVDSWDPVIVMPKNSGGFLQVKSPYAYYAYLGIFPIILLPLGILWAFKQRESVPLIFLGIWVFLMLLGKDTPVFALFWHLVPEMKYFRYSIHFLVFLEFLLAVFGGFGLFTLEQIVKKMDSGKRPNLCSLFTMAFVGFAFIDLFVHQFHVQPTKPANFWQDTPQILEKLQDVDWLNQRLGGFGLVEANNWQLSVDWPLQRSLRNFLPPNYNLMFGVPVEEIYTPLLLRHHVDLMNHYPFREQILTKEAIAQMENSAPDILVPLTGKPFKIESLSGTNYFISSIPLQYSALRELQALNLSHAVTEDLLGKDNDTGEIIKWPLLINKAYLYQIMDAPKRARVIGKAIARDADDSTLDYLFSDTFDVQGEVVVTGIEKDDVSDSQGEAKIVSDSGEEIIILAHASKNGWLYLADSYYPGWKATVDTVPTQIYRANYAFRAIRLPAGEHRIRFIYDPTSRKIGMGISSITLVLLIFFLLPRMKSVKVNDQK